MRFAYADPPYLGTAKRFYGTFHPEAAEWDDIETHRALIRRLVDEFPDGWALSMTEKNMRDLMPDLPQASRIAVWVKPLCFFKPNFPVAYAWEPIVWMGGRKRTRKQPSLRNWVSANATFGKGLPGAKPAKVAQFIVDLLNAQEGDEIVDLFSGTGGCGRVFEARLNPHTRQLELEVTP